MITDDEIRALRRGLRRDLLARAVGAARSWLLDAAMIARDKLDMLRRGLTDDDSDDLAGARGIINGVLIGVLMWAALVAGIYPFVKPWLPL